METPTSGEVHNSNLKQEYPRSADTAPSSEQKLDDLNAELDIIAVQGLASSYEWTWSIELENQKRYYWLRELLPKDVPKARILTFEYDSKWYSDPAHVTLEECGKRLLECVVQDRTHRGQTRICGGRRKRPLIFVGHSFGGLVIKQALVLASQTLREEPGYNDHQDILSTTAGIIFLGTPHRGSMFSRYARFKMWIGSFVGVATDAELVSILDLGSPALATLQENFQRIMSYSSLGNLQVFCFYETKELAAGLVVDRESACIGFGGEQSMEANHMEMNKFGPNSRSYQNYLLFVAQLLKMHEKGREIVQARFSASVYNSPQAGLNLSKIREWLRPSRDQQLQRFSDLLNERRHTPETCRWILQTEEYVQWKDREREQNCLWIHGKTGSGKSVLAAFLISVLGGDIRRKFDVGADISCRRRLDSPACDIDCQQAYAPTVLYFFGIEVQGSSTLVLLGTLIHQLLVKFDEDNSLVSMVQRFAREFTEPTEECLVELLTKMAEVVGVIHIVLDGLDEIANWEAVLQPLSKLRSSKAFHLIVLSQFDQRMFSGISTYLGSECVSFDITTHSYPDIRDFVKQKTTELIQLRPALACLEEFIVDHVLSRSDGMFQWVSLIMQDLLLHASKPDDVKFCLQDFPLTLNATYGRILSRLTRNCTSDRQKRRIRTALRWLATGARPLTARELRLAIALQEEDRDFVQQMLDEVHHPPSKDVDLESFFGTLLGSLVKVTNAETEGGANSSQRVVHLCHSSLRQLLLSGDDLKLEQSPEMVSLHRFCFAKNVAHALCAEECLDLCSTSLITLVDCNSASPQSAPLLRYSWDYCVYHLRHSGHLYATAKLPEKLDKTISCVLDDTLVLLDCISDLLCHPGTDVPLSAKIQSRISLRAVAASRMKSTVILQNAQESILPAVQALLDLKQLLPIGEKLRATERELRSLKPPPARKRGLISKLEPLYHRFQTWNHDVGLDRSSFLRLGLEEVIMSRPELLPVHLRSSKPFATAVKKLQAVTATIAPDSAYTQLVMVEDSVFSPVLALLFVAMLLEGIMNLPYRDTMFWHEFSNHFNCDSSDPLYGQIGIIHSLVENGPRNRGSATLQELHRVAQRQPISPRRYVVINGLLNLIRADPFKSIVIRPALNYWLRERVYLEIPFNHHWNKPQQNLYTTLRQAGTFENFTMADYYAEAPTLLVILWVKYLQTFMQALMPYGAILLHICVWRLRNARLVITSSYQTIRLFTWLYILAGFLVYVLRCMLLPSFAASLRPFPDILGIMRDPSSYSYQIHGWSHIILYYMGFFLHSGCYLVVAQAQLVPPPVARPWWHHALHVYAVFWNFAAMERAVHSAFESISHLLVTIGIVVFSEHGFSEFGRFTLNYWISVTIAIVGESITLAASLSNSLPILFAWLLIWIVFPIKLSSTTVAMIEGGCLWVLQVIWILAFPIRRILSQMVVLLALLVNPRMLAAITILAIVIWSVNYVHKIALDPYDLHTTFRELSRARRLIEDQVGQERLLLTSQGIRNRLLAARTLVYVPHSSVLLAPPKLPDISVAVVIAPSAPPRRASLLPSIQSSLQSSSLQIGATTTTITPSPPRGKATVQTAGIITTESSLELFFGEGVVTRAKGVEKSRHRDRRRDAQGQTDITGFGESRLMLEIKSPTTTSYDLKGNDAAELRHRKADRDGQLEVGQRESRHKGVENKKTI